MFCTKCGQKLEEGSKFCIKCGTPVVASSVPNTPPPVETFSGVTNEVWASNQEKQNVSSKPMKQTSEPLKKKNTKRNVLIAVAGVVLILVIVGVIFIVPKQDAGVFRANGDEYARKRDWNNAIKEYTKAIQIEPKNGLNYSLRGYIYWKEIGDVDRGVDDYIKAIKLNHHDGLFKYYLTEVLHKYPNNKKVIKAVTLYNKKKHGREIEF